MSKSDTLNELLPEGINISKLAQELGVDESHYVYPAGDVKKSETIFEYFRQNIQKDDQEHVSIEAEATIHISACLSELELVPYLPLFFPRIEGVEFWQKSMFFDLFLTYIICRGIQLRIKLLEDLRSDGTFLSDPAKFVPKLNDIELFNTFGAIFDRRVQPFLEQQPLFRSLREQILPLEDWFSNQLMMATRMKTPKRILQKSDEDFWSDRDLPVAKLFIANPTTYDMDPRELVPYIDRFLCHAESEYFDLIVGGIKSEKSGFLPRWRSWIYARKDLLLDENSTETQKIFSKIFRINGKITVDGELTEETKSKLPDVLIDAFESIIQRRKKAQGRLRQIVSHIPTPQPSKTAMAALTTAPVVVTRESIPLPSKSEIFGDTDTLKQNKEQLHQLDLTSLAGLPEGTKVELRYTSPGQKKPEIRACSLGKVEAIPVAQGKNIRGKFIYSLVITLPSTHKFESTSGDDGLKLEESWYAEAEWTPQEILEEEARLEQLRTQSQSVPTSTVVPVVAGVSQAIDTIVPKNPLKIAQESWHILLTETTDIGESIAGNGGIKFILPSEWQEGIDSVYHTISVSQKPESCSPSLGVDIDTILLQRARKIWEVESIRQERENEQIKIAEFLKKHEYLMQIFEEAAEKMKTEKKAGGIDTIVEKLLAKMRASEWITFSNNQGTQITLRHKGFVQIQFNGSSIIIIPENSYVLTDIEKTGYRIVAERLRDILSIINTKKPQERIQLARQMSERREAVVVYRETLCKSQARLIVLPPPENEGTGFPKGIYPLVINDISHDNIDAKIAELEVLYPGCSIECCLIKDAITINGPASKMPATILADSERGMYILRKRVLISLKILPDTDDPNRAPIDAPKKKKLSGVPSENLVVGVPLDPLPPVNERSPRVILEVLAKEEGVETAEAVTDDFLRLYLQRLQKNDVLVGYTYPVSMTWESLLQMTQAKTTAD